PSVIGPPLDEDLETGDANDAGDEPDVAALPLQHRPLLDMQFEERRDFGGTHPQNHGRIAADGSERIGKRAALVPPREPRLGHLSGHASAADAGDAEWTHLL